MANRTHKVVQPPPTLKRPNPENTNDESNTPCYLINMSRLGISFSLTALSYYFGVYPEDTSTSRESSARDSVDPYVAPQIP